MAEFQSIQMNCTIPNGNPYPLGATFYSPGPFCKKQGVNFSVFSQFADKIDLLLFENRLSVDFYRKIELNRKENYDYGFWHVFVEDIKPGIYYAYRCYSSNINASNKILLDPYGKGIDTSLWDAKNALGTNDIYNIATSMRSCVLDMSGYDWENTKKPQIPFEKTIIYEMHVRGFTKSTTSNVINGGTYSGVIEKIPYLKKLGITAVELLPVMQFDETEPNYWGYNTVGFFAPHSAYCISVEEINQVNEFRSMVKELHKEGIEVILDVVYNHTREGDKGGPVISFKGFDNELYYAFDENGNYQNFSGCGNSFSCNHPIVQKLVMESLEFWAREMQVDGFRFDLGTVLTMDSHGHVMEYPPVIWGIELNERLTDCKLIAEPWAAQENQDKTLYQVGKTEGYRWSQWNDKYRDCIRNFVKGTPGIIGEVAKRMSGSPDLYEWSGHLPNNSINFITCHDGFTLNDLVSYTNKSQNSWNCGVNGPTNNDEIMTLRNQQIKNFVAILFLSKGIPMILSGDELKRTQNGVSNGYRLDNENGWINWDLLSENEEIFKFFQKMINLRKQTFFLQTKHFYTGNAAQMHTRNLKDIAWHGTKLNNPGWNEFSRILAFTISGVPFEYLPKSIDQTLSMLKDEDIHVMMNMYWEPLVFEIPKIDGRNWFVYTDTAEKQNAEDIFYSQDTYLVKPRSIAILVSKPINSNT